MMIGDAVFYAFAAILLIAALLVVTARNPVHSVLWLILCFLTGAGMMILLGAELIALMLIIVYVGAVAVLFLFVVMMLDVDFAALRSDLVRYVPVGGLIGVVILMQLVLALGSWDFAPGAEDRRLALTPDASEVHNTEALGLILYDQYLLLFQLAGLILLVAMIGAIVLTLRHRKDVRRQDVLAQMYRDPAKAMKLKDVKSGQGL